VISATQASLRVTALVFSSLEISSLITSHRYSTLQINVWVLQHPQEVCKKEQVWCEIRAWFQEQLTEPSHRTQFSMESNILLILYANCIFVDFYWIRKFMWPNQDSCIRDHKYFKL